MGTRRVLTASPYNSCQSLSEKSLTAWAISGAALSSCRTLKNTSSISFLSLIFLEERLRDYYGIPFFKQDILSGVFAFHDVTHRHSNHLFPAKFYPDYLGAILRCRRGKAAGLANCLYHRKVLPKVIHAGPDYLSNYRNTAILFYDNGIIRLYLYLRDILLNLACIYDNGLFPIAGTADYFNGRGIGCIGKASCQGNSLG